MSKVRVYEVARQLGVDQKTLVALFQSLGFADIHNHMSAVEIDAVERVKRHVDKQKSPAVVEERIRPTVVKRRAVTRPTPSAIKTEAAPVVASEQPVAVAPTPRRAARAPAKKAQEPAAVEVPQAPAAEVGAPASEELRAKRAVRAPAKKVSDRRGEAAAADLAQAPSEVGGAKLEQGAAEGQVPAAGVEPTREAASHEPLFEQGVDSLLAQAAAARTGLAERVEAASADLDVSARAEELERDKVSAFSPARSLEAPETRAKFPGGLTSEPIPSRSKDEAAPTRAQAVPRTGIEMWAGRPGVPMPAPSAVRPAAGPVPRRVQYDPKAGAAAGKADARSAGGARKPAWGKARRMQGVQPLKRTAAPSTKEMSEHKKVIKIEEKVSLQTLAQRMSLKATEVLMKLLSMGMPGVNINSTLDADTAKLLASEFGWDVEDVSVSEEEALGIARGSEVEEQEGEITGRPPIVTVMGHVDHGKTSLLDQIRKTNVAATEAGGITQHIGAYRVNTSRGPITFVDTPGHAAFTQMRARGAQVTDLVVLVVAADDGVMPQTREAVNHARAAKVPILVAVNKIDKPGSQPEKVRRELAELELVPEDWGGNTIFCEVSAKTRQGIDNLLEMIVLQAEVLSLHATPSRPAVGHVLEALLDRGRGPVARVIITDGTLNTGDILLAGAAWGKLRAMTDDRGRMVAEAGPSTPVEVLGLSEVPNAGDPVHVVKDPKKAQEIAQGRKSKATRSLIPASAKVSLEDLAKRIAEAGQLELRLIIKADVQGSVEALAESLAQLSTDKVKVAIIHAGVGGITEGDINLAVASKAIILGFNVRSAGKAGALAEAEGVQIKTYNVIYNAVDDIKKAMIGMLAPTIVERNVGKAEVRQTFHIAKIGTVAGCFVQEGTIKRSARVRLVRDSVLIWEGRFSTVKRFKEDAREVEKGLECGLSFDGFSDVKVGDVVECFETEEVAAAL